VVERQRLGDHAAVGEPVQVDGAQAEGADQAGYVSHVAGEGDGAGVLDGLRPAAAAVVEVDDAVALGQRVERRVENDVRAGRAAGEQEDGLARAMLLDPEAGVAHRHEAAGGVGDGRRGV
jgi:hypothetical protein